MAQNKYTSQDIEDQQPVVPYLQHFFVYQPVVYLLAKVKMKKKEKFFFKTSMVQNFVKLHTFQSISKQTRIFLEKRFYNRFSYRCPHILKVQMSLQPQYFFWNGDFGLFTSPARSAFQTKNPNSLSPKDPPDTKTLTVPLAYVSMEGFLCVVFFAKFCLLSELRKQLRSLPIVFPPQCLNYSPLRRVTQHSLILKKIDVKLKSQEI